MEARAQDAEVKGVFLLRDKDGNVKYDDPNNVPPEVIEALSPKDLEYLNQLKEAN